MGLSFGRILADVSISVPRLFEGPMLRWVFENDPTWYRESYRELCFQILEEIDRDRQ